MDNYLGNLGVLIIAVAVIRVIITGTLYAIEIIKDRANNKI